MKLELILGMATWSLQVLFLAMLCTCLLFGLLCQLVGSNSICWSDKLGCPVPEAFLAKKETICELTLWVDVLNGCLLQSRMIRMQMYMEYSGQDAAEESGGQKEREGERGREHNTQAEQTQAPADSRSKEHLQTPQPNLQYPLSMYSNTITVLQYGSKLSELTNLNST